MCMPGLHIGIHNPTVTSSASKAAILATVFDFQSTRKEWTDRIFDISLPYVGAHRISADLPQTTTEIYWSSMIRPTHAPFMTSLKICRLRWSLRPCDPATSSNSIRSSVLVAQLQFRLKTVPCHLWNTQPTPSPSFAGNIWQAFKCKLSTHSYSSSK